MAIQCKITTIQGVQLDTAYINIQCPQILKAKQEDGTNKYVFGGSACVYVCKECYEDNKIPIESFSVSCDLDINDNMFNQAYDELKKNERLEEAVDC